MASIPATWNTIATNIRDRSPVLFVP